MTVLEYYVERNRDSNYVEKYQSTAGKNCGKFFSYINTNFRSLMSFESQFKNFLSFNELDRSEWSRHPSHGQEIAKQYVVNMRQSKLFKIDGSKYKLTYKGLSFKDMLGENFKDNEKWFLIYLYLLNSYFNLKPSYILKQVNSFVEVMSDQDYKIDFIKEEIITVLKKNIRKRETLFNEDIFWIVSFYRDEDFLEIFLNSSDFEKQELKNHIISKYKNKIEDDLIVKKYKNSGQYTLNTFMDDLKVIYSSIHLTNSGFNNYQDAFFSLLEDYALIYSVDENRIKKFIVKERDVFNAIYRDLFGDIEEDLIYNYLDAVENKTEASYISENIDTTTDQSYKDIAQVSTILKRIAKEKTNFHCELENINDCRYFTSKENGHNYLEIHHLIPREFSNEFEKSIEVIDNYVALCPHCHRMLHFANDRERYSAIKYLFTIRKVDLSKKQLDVDIDQLKEFYGIEE